MVGKIKSDLVVALKSGESLRVSVLRMLLSELNYKQIDVQRELTEEDVLAVVQREVKKRREAIESYRAGGREEQANTETEELAMLLTYLPTQMSATEVEQEIGQILAGKKYTNFGEAMKEISPKFKGRADGSVVARVVKSLIGDRPS